MQRNQKLNPDKQAVVAKVELAVKALVAERILEVVEDASGPAKTYKKLTVNRQHCSTYERNTVYESPIPMFPQCSTKENPTLCLRRIEAYKQIRKKVLLILYSTTKYHYATQKQKQEQIIKSWKVPEKAKVWNDLIYRIIQSRGYTMLTRTRQHGKVMCI